MITVKIVEKESFEVYGIKTWITGQHNEEFAEFWSNAHEAGIVEKLKKISAPKVMSKGVMGISRVENDPDNRSFYFFVCSETSGRDYVEEDMERFVVPASKWAVFINHCYNNNLGEALIKAEIYCHMEWLESSRYKHAMAPEIEFYPEQDGTCVEYWMPIVER